MDSVKVPVIDLAGLREKVVEEVRDASEKWGSFQIVNHGVPINVLGEMLKAVEKFHEEENPSDEKVYKSAPMEKVRLLKGFKRDCPNPMWKKTLTVDMVLEPPSYDEFPSPCREKLMGYAKHMERLGETMLGIMSEALGLSINHLKNMECLAGMRFSCHCYPACPDFDMTIGTLPHSDPSFFTILLQDQVGGLQISYRNSWILIPPIRGALIVHIGDLFQLITNDRFKSVVHRVVNSPFNTRISVACLVDARQSKVKYGPLKEILSTDGKAFYKETFAKDYSLHMYTNIEDYTTGLHSFRTG